MRPRRDLFDWKPPVLIGWAPDPQFPQTNLRIVARTMTPRVLATSTTPASPGAATFKLSWESRGSPSQVQIFRQQWRLGARNTREFTAEPAVVIRELGAIANGFHVWTDPSPALNTRNCYFIKAGDGTYFSYSNTDCAYAPDPDNPHPVGKVSIRLKVAAPGTARTADNVRVRLNYGIPGEAPVYTWLDATDYPFFTPGGEQTFILRSPEIKDLSDITMIRVEVPGTDDLCLQDLELKVDDSTAFRKSSATQACGPGNPFEWAQRSGYIDGSVVEIPFEELRNSGSWRDFNPPVLAGTATFIGYTAPEFRRLLDGITGHKLKEDGSQTGSGTRQLRNGNNDVTTLTRLNDHELIVRQHMRIADGTVCTVDAHPVFKLVIRHLDADGKPFTGSTGNIEATRVTSELLDAGIDQNGFCQFVPGLGQFIQHNALGQFGRAFAGAGGAEPTKPPPGMRYCFPGQGVIAIRLGFENGGFSVCFGVN